MSSQVTPQKTRVFETWKTLKCDTSLKSADDFRKEVVKVRMKIDDRANDILGKPAFTTTTSETEVELVIASVAELGFKDGTALKNIYVRSQELGLDLCPPKDGPQLRVLYTDQPKDEWLVIAMEPIADSNDHLSLFFVVHDNNELWLYACHGHPGLFYDEFYHFVFRRRKLHSDL